MRPTAAELDFTTYPFNVTLQTRFGDLDILNHVNNVQINQLFEEGRFRFSSGIQQQSTTDHLQQNPLLSVAIVTNYLGEVTYPDDVTVYTGVFQLGKSSLTLCCLMLQQGRVVAHSRTTAVCVREGKPIPLPAALRDHFSRYLLTHSEAASSSPGNGHKEPDGKPEPGQLLADNYPFSDILPTRYSDLDCFRHLNNVRIAQLLDEARVRFARQTFSHDTESDAVNSPITCVRLVVVSTRMTYFSEGAYPCEAQVFSGVSHIGKSAFAIDSLMLQNNQLIAHCRATVVHADDAQTRPLPDQIMAELQNLRLRQAI